MFSSRREILARLGFGCLFIPAIARAPGSVLGSLLFDPDAPVVSPKPIPVNPFTKDGKSLVAIVHGQDVPAMLGEGLRLLGGLDRLPLAGQRVLLKPNVVNDRPPPTTTNPAVVGAVASLARAAGAAEVIVGDSSGIIRFPTSGNLKATGIQEAAEAAGARVISFDELTPQPWVRVEPPGAKALPHYYVSRAAYEADIFINLPVVKTHRFAHYSCCLKNLVGITHPRYRPSVTFLSGDWHERIAELNLAVHPHLHIADGTTVMIAGGPTSGTPAPANVLLLSGDRVALDVVALALVRTYAAWDKVKGGSVWTQRQIMRAIELGLGAGGPQEVELVAGSVNGSSREFEQRVEAIRKDVGKGKD
jgi:uncharacterized protein (DUF362 family)